jgi:hypothetical protein
VTVHRLQSSLRVLQSAIRNPQSAICSLEFASLILIALLAAAALWGPGIVNTRGGGDSPFLLQRTHQMVENLREGIFPARWMPDAAYGLGYPFFNYYAALPYYLAGGLVLVGLNILTALKLVQTLGFVAAALGMYGWMRGMTRNRWAAWLAAVAYTVAPFHLINVYVRGDSLSEFYAFVFYPLILWSLRSALCSSAHLRPCKSAPLSSGSLVIAALAYAALLLTHNISAAIFSPFVVLYISILAWQSKDRFWSILLKGALALGLGFLISAWFWLPAVAELDVAQLGPSTEGYFHYSQHFRSTNLVQWRFLFDYSIKPDLTGRSPFAMGLPQAILAILGGVLLLTGMIYSRRKSSGPDGVTTRYTTGYPAFTLVGLLVSTLMVTPLSRLLWDHLPLLPVVQFPWRFLSVQALFTAAATAALADHIGRDSAREKLTSSVQWGVAVAIIVALILTASTLLPLRPDRLTIGPDDVTRERLLLYEVFTGNIGTTIRHEWLPQTASPRPFISDVAIDPDAPARAIPLEGASLNAAIVEREPTRQFWRVEGDGGAVALPLVYWPGWEAQIDGRPTSVWPVEGSGYLALYVPPGEHQVTLQLGRTPVRLAAELISLAAALGSVTWLGIAGYSGAREQGCKGARERATPRPCSPVCLILCAFATLLFCVTLSLWSTYSAPSFADSTLTMDFDQMPFLHQNPEGIAFQEDIRLVSYDLSAEEVASGETLSVAMEWDGLGEGPYTATLSLVSPAATRHDVLPLSETTVTPINTQTVTLPLPADVPRGLYLIQLRLFGPEGELRALTSGGSTRGTLYLRPIRVTDGPQLRADAPVLAPIGPAIRLHAATIAPVDAHHLSIELVWSAAQPVAANYGISLRLLDAAGDLRASFDSQPGYGFLPTSTWRPGASIGDRYLFALPEDLPQGEGYRLQVVLYQTPTLEPVGQAQLGSFALPLDEPFEASRPPRVFSVPDLENPVEVSFGEEVTLLGYETTQSNATLDLTLWWQANAAPRANYTVFVHLFDPATAQNVAQSDAQPRGGAYPTSWWIAGEVISDTATLPLDGVPPGTYQLAVGMYDYTVTRLPAVTADGERVPDDRLILSTEVRIP